jgi:predicted transcriptional regulator
LGISGKNKGHLRQTDMGQTEKAAPEKRIRDLMIRLDTLHRVPPQTKVREGVNVLSEKWGTRLPPFVLVVDEIENKEEILGMLSLNDVLRHLESSSGPVDELPIFWQGQFREECESVLNMSTGEIMSPVALVIKQNCTLTEAVHLMYSKCVDWLPVVEGEQVVGILLQETLLGEVVAVAEPKLSLNKDQG